MTIRNLAIALGVLALITAASAYAKKAPSAQEFVTKATVANQFEIDTSKLALDKSQNTDIKKFAQMVIDDHMKAGDTLKGVLSSSPSKATPAKALDAKHQKKLDMLATSGDDFDKNYIMIQKDAHKEAVALFTDYSKNGDDKALKKFAAETLPTLKKHMDHVAKLSAAH